MRLALLLLMLISILISGCASHSVDCTMGAGHNGCAPGTREYEQMVQLQQDAKSAAEIDDAVCRSFGAEAGSAAYAECRRKRAVDHQLIDPPRTVQTRPLSDSK